MVARRKKRIKNNTSFSPDGSLKQFDRDVG